MEIRYVEGLDTFRHYRGQTNPQRAEIVLDCEHEILTAGYATEIGSGMPARRYYNREIAWTIPHLRTTALKNLMDEIAPLAEIILDGYTEKYDRNNNHIGVLDDDAENAYNAIENIINSHRVNDSGYLRVWSASDFYGSLTDEMAASMLGVRPDSTDEDLADMNVLSLSGDEDEVDVLTGTTEYLQGLRDHLRDRQ